MPNGASDITLDLHMYGVDSTIISAEPALTRIGSNRWTLGRHELDGTAQDFNFTVVGGTGVIAAPFTLRLMQRPALTDNGWSALVTAPGFTSPVSLTPTSTGIIQLPTEAAFGNAIVTLSLPTGAFVTPVPETGGMLVVSLGDRGSNVTLTFTVIAENGMAATPFTVTFAVAQSSDNSWRAHVAAPGLVDDILLTQASTAFEGIIHLPAFASFGTATVTLFLPTGASVSPTATTGGVLIVSLGAAGTMTSLTFIVSAENGMEAKPFIVSFQLAALVPIESSSTGMSMEVSSTGNYPTHTPDASSSTGILMEGSSSGSYPTHTSDASSSTGVVDPVVTYSNATVIMQLYYNTTTIPPTLISDLKAGIVVCIRFPAKVGQALHAFYHFVRRSGVVSLRRLLQYGGGATEMTQLTITFTPTNAHDDGATKAALAFSTQLRCLTSQCATDAAVDAGVSSVYSSPLLNALVTAIDPNSVIVHDGITPPPPPQPRANSSSSSGMPGGTIAGIVIAVVIGVLLLVIISFYVMRTRSSSTIKATSKVAHNSTDNKPSLDAELTQVPNA